jgi:hypothetical protein
MTAQIRTIALLASLLATTSLGACHQIHEASAERAAAQTASIEHSRTYAKSKSEVWDSVKRTLAEYDIAVLQEDFERGLIHARHDFTVKREWARCPYGRIFDPVTASNLYTRAWPLWAGVDLQIQVRENDSGSELLIDPAFYDRQIDTDYRRFPYQVPCYSTGVIEAALLAAP